MVEVRLQIPAPLYRGVKAEADFDYTSVEEWLIEDLRERIAALADCNDTLRELVK